MSDDKRSNLGNPVQLLEGLGDQLPSGLTPLFSDPANAPPSNTTAPRQFASPTATPFTAQAPIPTLRLLPGMKSATIQNMTPPGASGVTLPKKVGGASGIVAWVKANPLLALGGAAVAYIFLFKKSGGLLSGSGLGDLGRTKRGKRVGGLGCVCDD